MSRFRPTFFIPLIAFLGLAIIGGLALQGTLSGSRNPNQLPSVLIGKPAPDVPLPLLQDSQAELALDAYRGQPLLVNFFASWCAPCRAEAPALEHLSNQISIIGIAYKDRPQDTQKFLQQYGNPFVAIGRDDDGRAGMAWGVYGVPETYLIDPSGQIKWRHAGPLTRDVITSQLMQKLAEMQ
ncbi:MAG: DsbE family thiol:disulfide interchange protein [Proteobacteria bacterium]|nr:DsbE family thiol:disulfide interchange protein [Pseudomonadota bacterium]